MVADGGRIVAGGATVRAEKADSVTLIIAAATSFNGPLKSPGREGRDPAALASSALQAAGASAYADLLTRHITDYQKLFDRVTLDLGHAAEAASASPQMPASPVSLRAIPTPAFPPSCTNMAAIC